MPFFQEITVTARVIKPPKVEPNRFDSTKNVLKMVVELLEQPYPTGNGETKPGISKFLFVDHALSGYGDLQTKVVEGTCLVMKVRLTGAYKDGKYPSGYYIKANEVIVVGDLSPAKMINRVTARAQVNFIGKGDVDGTSKVLLREPKRPAVGKDKPKPDYKLMESWHYYIGVVNTPDLSVEKYPIGGWVIIQGRLAKGLVIPAQDDSADIKKKLNQPVILIDKMLNEI